MPLAQFHCLARMPRHQGQATTVTLRFCACWLAHAPTHGWSRKQACHVQIQGCSLLKSTV